MALPKPALQILLITVSGAAFVGILFCSPIRQPEAFHQFADTRTIWGIPNGWNVLSNLAFALVGIAGMGKIRNNSLCIVPEMKASYCCFFTAVLLVAAGSSWYHYHPDTMSLLWDRLPMTIAFMSLLSIGLAEFMDVPTGRKALLPLLMTGIFSVAWWRYGEWYHHGDLRLYALVQFLPILLLALLFVFGRPVFSNSRGYIALFGAYVLAKLAEHFDRAIYQYTGQVLSGHFLKHILTAIGLWCFLQYVQKRKIRSG